jgi:putative endonuclease
MTADWHLYMLRCADGSLYTGISTDVARRLREHTGGGARGASYLRGRAPLVVVYTHALADRAAASIAEHAVKQLTRPQKEQLIAGHLSLRAVLCRSQADAASQTIVRK